MNDDEIRKAFDEWWERHQLSKSSMDQDDAIYAFKYGYKSGDKEISELKELCAENYSQLLCEAKNLYTADRTYKRKTVDEYFKEESDFLSKLKEKS